MHDSTYLAELSNDAFIRERISPRKGDFYYLHLSDLLMALSRYGTQDKITILDFGCGGSPYRSLFPNAEYRRADVKGSKDIDFEINESGRISATSNSFDLIMSSQVLEHCPSPKTYLFECNRLLKDSGRLLLSTHGMFEEHGAPFDFHRWTEDGLRALLTECGFALDSISRLTMGPRAAFQLLRSSLSQTQIGGRGGGAGLILRPVWRLLIAKRRIWDSVLDQVFPDYRVSDSRRLPGDNLYIDLLAVAKPLKNSIGG